MPGPRAILALLLVYLWSANPGFSQAVSATLLGTVTDASGAVVPDAKITLTETNTGVSH